MSIKKDSAAKIGLFSAIMVIIGSMVGISIFFKNETVFNANNNNPYGILLSWILGFLIALAVGFSFTEIVSSNKKSNIGLGGYCHKFIGRRFGRFIEISHPLFYYSLYALILSTFSGEAIWNCFSSTPGSIDAPFAYIMLIGLALVIFFIFLNWLSLKVGSMFANITTILKFVPLIAIGIFGIVAGFIGRGSNFFDPSNPDVGTFDMTGVLASLPAIMFAFDSFLIIGNIASDMKKPERDVPLTIVISMIIAGVLYLFITIGQIAVGNGNAYELFIEFFKNNEVAGQAFSILTSIFILIACLGCVNSISVGAVRSMQIAIEKNKIVGSKTLLKWGNGKHLMSGIICLIISYIFWWIIILIPSVILDTDQIIDGVSNTVVAIYFGVYAIVILFAMINRKTKKVNVTKQKGFLFFGSFAVFGCALIFSYSMFYQYSFINLSGVANLDYNVWGLFLINTYTLKYWQAAIIFWAFVIGFLIVPYINDLLIKITNKNYNQQLLV